METIEKALLLSVSFFSGIDDDGNKGQDLMEKMVKAAFEEFSFNPNEDKINTKEIEDNISNWLGDPDNEILFYTESIKVKAVKKEQSAEWDNEPNIVFAEDNENLSLFRCRVRADPDLGIDFQVELLAKKGNHPFADWDLEMDNVRAMDYILNFNFDDMDWAKRRRQDSKKIKYFCWF